MDSWNTCFLLGPGLFSEAMLALGSIPHIANPSRQAAFFAPHHSLGPGIQWVLRVNEKITIAEIKNIYSAYIYILCIIYTVYIRLSPLPVTVAKSVIYQGSPTKYMTVTGQGDNSIYIYICLSIYINMYIYTYKYIPKRKSLIGLCEDLSATLFSKEPGDSLAPKKKNT